MSLYNGLERSQWDQMTKLLNILSDRAKTREELDHINTFKAKVVIPAYTEIVKELNNELKELQSKSLESGIMVKANADLPAYVIEALEKYKKERSEPFQERAREIKRDIENINIALTMTLVPAKEAAEKSVEKPAEKPAEKPEAKTTCGEKTLIMGIPELIAATIAKDRPTLLFDANHKEPTAENIESSILDLIKLVA